MLHLRLLTSVIVLPFLALYLAYASKAWIFPFFLLCVGLSVWEMASIIYPSLKKKLDGQGLAEPDSKREVQRFAFGTLVCALLLYCLLALDFGSDLFRVIASFLTLVFLLLQIFNEKNIEENMSKIVSSLLCLVYGCLPWLSVWELYLMEPHSYLLFLLLTIVMLNDTGAYFCGLKFGKHKLAPRLSPKKTIEGAVGGLFSGVIGAIVWDKILGRGIFSLKYLVFCALLVGAFSILGDLVESFFKRYAKVKDSGRVFPGHGGFLDRVDGIMFAAPMLCLLVSILKFV